MLAASARAGIGVVLLASGVCAQAVRRVEVEVTAVSGRSVYVDQGRAAAIEAGDAVVLYPRGGEPVRARIQSVSRTSARVELPAVASGIEPGVRGEVLIPAGRSTSGESDDAAPRRQSEPDVPEHPPWTQPIEGWQDDRPLLAPAFGQGPAARPTRVHGRAFAQMLHTWDRGLADRRFLLGRVGTDVRIENPFKAGGRLHLDGELTRRENHFDDFADDETTRARLDRASYAWGDTPDAPVRVELGRFLSSEFPELGVLDGVEAHLPAGNGGRAGVSLGAFPEPFPTMNSGEDFQTALFYRYRSDDEERTVAGIAYQKTWHRGAPDRDLVFADLALRPTDELSVYASAWVDYYTAGDTIKSRGFELTELHLHANYRLGDHGFGARGSTIRWPELDRDEFRAVTPDLIRDNRSSRVGVSGWHRLGKGVRIDERADYWQDQDQDGVNADLRLALRDLVYERGEISIGVFTANGAFDEGYGLRLSASRSFDGGTRARVGWEGSRFESSQLTSGARRRDLMALTANVDLALSAAVDLSVHADYRFGDGQDAFTLGLFSQVRF